MKRSGRAGFSLIIAGAVFIFNPLVTMIDPLPDFFGILFILAGMKKLRDVNPHCERARALMKKTMWADLGRLAAMMLSVGALRGDDNMTLVFLTVFGILEIAFFIPAVKELIEGTEYVRLDLAGRSDEDGATSLSVMTGVFVTAKNILAIIPPMLSLFDTEYGDVESGGARIGLSTLKTVALIICTAIAFAVGTAWLVMTIKYFRALSRDGEFCEKLCDKYEKCVLGNERLMRLRSVNGFFALVVPATATLICLRLDVYFLSPAFAFGVTCAFAFRVCGKFSHTGRAKRLLLCVGQAAAGLAAALLSVRYGDLFGGYLYPYGEKGFAAAFIALMAAEVVSSVMTALVLRLISATERDMCDKCVGWGEELPGREELDAELKKEVRKKIRSAEICGMAYCVASVVCMAVIPFENSSDLLGLSWAVRTALAVITAIKQASVAGALRDEAGK